MSREKITTAALAARKKSGPKIAVVTAYDATMASLLDRGGVDVLMIGDSVGMVVQGHDNTLCVTLDDMIYHCRAVSRARPAAHIVCDLPFMSYQVSDEEAVRAAGRLMKEGRAEAVKLEGGDRVVSAVRRMVLAGIPVMGHLGLTPQSVHQMGGFRVQAKTTMAARRLLEEAQGLEEAGVYSLVLEGVPSEVAQMVTEAISVPTIGIGAGPDTDGQVLVCYDLLGMYGKLSPKFVKRFADMGQATTEAIESYVDEVRGGRFPGPEHTFSMARGQHLPEESGE